MRSFLCFVMVLIFNSGYSQLQLRISGEYGVGLQKDFLQNVDALGNVTNIKGSFGNGILVNFSAGYGFGNNASILVDLSYLSSVNFQKNTFTPDGRTELFTVTQGTYFSVTPNLMIKTTGTGVQPYLRVGPILAFPRVTEDISYEGEPAGKNIYAYTSGIAMGMMGAVGVEFFAGDGAVIFVEFVSRNLTYHPRKLENVETYKDFETDSDKYFKSNPETAEELPAVSKPFSSIGGSIGIKLNIHMKKEPVIY